MTEKYTIQDHDDYCTLYENGKGKERFEDFDLAKLVCRLLNENEAKTSFAENK